MPQAEAKLTLKVVAKGAKKALGGIPKLLGSIGKAALKGIAGLGGFAAAAVKLAGTASQFKAVQDSFNNLAAAQGEDADAMLAKMKELSQGTISDMKLMQQANNALLLGLPVDRFGDMVNIARSASKATGESMEFMLKSITTGLGRGSKLMLDNLGIVFRVEDANREYAETMGIVGRELTEAEKKQAFINKALEVGAQNAEAAGDGQLTLSERFQQVKATAENLAVVIGTNLGPTFKFLLEEATKTFEGIENWTKSQGATEVFIFMTKALAQLKTGFKVLGGVIAVVLNDTVESAKAIFSGNFGKGPEIAKQTIENFKEVMKNGTTELNEDLAQIDKNFKDNELKRATDTSNAILVNKKRELLKKQQMEEEAAQLKFDKDLEKKEFELEFMNATELEKLEARKAFLEQHTVMEQNSDEQNLRNKALTAEQKKKIEKDLQRTEAQILKQKEADRKSSLSTIATLQNSHNKTLAGIGKAAALTQIAIDGPAAVVRAYKAFPPPFNFVAGAAVAAAVASQAANVMGVQLAEGGIVTPTPGGTQATIGEAGRSEAVIPLPDDFDPDEGGAGGVGGAVTIQFSGPVLGDESQAMEFARMVDRGLLELRRGNESVSFEEDVI